MNKTIKTIKINVRKLLNVMINKYKEKQHEIELVVMEKQCCLNAITEFIANLKDVEEIGDIRKTIEKLNGLVQKESTCH